MVVCTTLDVRGEGGEGVGLAGLGVQCANSTATTKLCLWLEVKEGTGSLNGLAVVIPLVVCMYCMCA